MRWTSWSSSLMVRGVSYTQGHWQRQQQCHGHLSTLAGPHLSRLTALARRNSTCGVGGDSLGLSSARAVLTCTLSCAEPEAGRPCAC